jgi:uncharacterized repeat protein (TIGR03803 family)
MKSSLQLTSTRYLRIAILAICLPMVIATTFATPPTITVQPQITSFSLLHSFIGDNDGGNPDASLIRGTDGRLYGTTPSGGTTGNGNIFAVNPDGTGYVTLYSFTGGNDGSSPYGGLIQGIDGRLYGTTPFNGANGSGTVFAVNSDGTGFTTLYSLTGGNDGASPTSNLIQGPGGRLYGTTTGGGVNGFGTVFAINPDGTNFATLCSFSGTNDGAFPSGGLILGTDGRLYGTTPGSVFSSNNSFGTVFAINLDGTGFTTLYTFANGNDGANPYGGVIQGTDGRLYGTTADWGGGTGTVFAINPDGTGFTTLYSFTGGNDGGNPYVGLIQGTDGHLYGTTASGGTNNEGAVFALNPDGTDFITLYNFTGGSDGLSPQGGLFQGTDGRLYGSAQNGGITTFGTLFAISSQVVLAGTNATVTVAATGTAPLSYQWQFNGADIAGATGATLTITNVTAANAGSYTVVVSNAEGSAASTSAMLTVTLPPPPATPVFTPPAGTYSTVQSVFISSLGATSIYYTTDGSTPTIASTLYTGAISIPTTTTLSAIGVNPGGLSPVMSGVYVIHIPPQVTSQPAFSLLHDFTGSDGSAPYGELLQGTDGRLYGTTQGGGVGGGTVFTMNADGTGFITLHSFTFNGNDGTSPSGSLIQGTDGRLYGTTYGGGASDFGTVFAINPNGTGFATLYSFTNGSDGAQPFGSLLQGTDGRLYGTTNSGGPNGVGTVFAANSDGTGFTILHGFTNGNDGAHPIGGLIQGTDSRLYGTTNNGGPNGAGTVFAVNPDGAGFTILYSFTGGIDGGYPQAGLLQRTDGRLYGTAFVGANGAGTMFAVNADGTGFTTLYSFTDGNLPPTGSLIQGTDGRLYGTTEGNGAGSSSIDRYGTVFAVNPDGTGFATLYRFLGGNDGSTPFTGVIQGTDGRLYGTTLTGGIRDFAGDGFGTVFAISSPRAVAGTNVTYTAAASGTGPLSYQWQLNGVNIPGATGATLTLTNVTVSNSGSYTVVVTNAYGSVTSDPVTLAVIGPAISSLNPSTVTAGSGAFTLTVNGTNFANGAVVNWNGSARPTTFVNGSTLTAAIPAADIATSNDLATALITVQSAGGDLSNAVALPIVSANVAAVQSNTAADGSSATASTAPSTAGAAGITAFLQNNSTAPAAVTVANYTTNPTGVIYFDVGGGFVDLQVTGATAADIATADFYYPNTITGTTETNLTLLYFDGSAWQPVLSSGGVAPAKDTTDNLDGTVSGGRFTVVFDNTSTPVITNLVGTVFTFSLRDTIPPVIHSITATPGLLTPPNNKLVKVKVTVNATDNLDPHPTSKIIAVTSNEPTDNDVDLQITGPLTLNLRAERDGNGNGRIYTITIQTSDASGNKTTGTTQVIVPKDPDAAKDRPAIAKNPQSQTVTEGTDVTFTVAVAPALPVTYQWRFNGKAIAGATDATLTLHNVTLGSAGDYTAVVTNTNGSTISDEADLKVLPPPPVITSISPSTVKAGSGAFTFTVSGTGFINGSVIKWNAEKLTTTFVSSTILTAAVLGDEIPKKKSGTASITVQSPGGDLSNAKTLTITL